MEPKRRLYRCTFPRAYSVGTPGYTDPRARQGYYVIAESPEAAADEARARTDRKGWEVDVEEWP